MSQNKIAIIGAGNLGQAIGQGIANKNMAPPENIILTKRDQKDVAFLKKKGFQITDDNREAVSHARFIFICVQPKQSPAVFREIKPVLQAHHVIISVMAGVTIEQIQKYAGLDVPVIRAMPNTAISIGQSMTCLAASDKAEKHLEEVRQLFNTVGKTLVIEENLVQAATVLGASGIAFFMRYLRAVSHGGVQMGFDAEDAQTIAVQTAKGAAQLVQENQNHPEVEIDRVTTPQGCTIEGLNEMEHQGLSSAIIRGLMASYQRITYMKDRNND